MKTIRSIQCGRCTNEYWEVDGDEARCMNCRFARPFHRRGCGSEITPSQKRVVERIRSYFDGSWSSGGSRESKELHLFEIEMNDGICYVTVEDDSHLLIMRGGYFRIGRRGKLMVISARGIFGDAERYNNYLDHLALILRGHVPDWVRRKE